jgi:hypothetical protein
MHGVGLLGGKESQLGRDQRDCLQRATLPANFQFLLTGCLPKIAGLP